MSVAWQLHLIAGLDHRLAIDARGRTLLDRLQAGEWGTLGEDDLASPSAIADWIHRHKPAGLQAFTGGVPGEGDQPLVLGVPILHHHEHELERYAEPIPLAAFDDALTKARQGLRALGIAAEPRLYLLSGVV